MPREGLSELNRAFGLRRLQRDPAFATGQLWKWSRTTAWWRVKKVTAAAVLGLRHGFGVNAFQSNAPPHLVQRWLGHASPRTTAIYGDVMGPNERAFAVRMWCTIRPRRKTRPSRSA
jgi:integrase/recombinase XerD